MKNLSLPVLLIIGVIHWPSTYQPVRAQSLPRSNTAICGTTELTPAQRLLLVQQMNRVLQRKRAARDAPATITYVPIRPHIVRRSDGTGGYPLASLNEAMATTNYYFLLNGFGIQFYFAGASPDYIDDDGLYDAFTSYPVNRDAYDALNQYYINVFPPEIQNGGFASFPADNIESTRSVIRTYGDNNLWFKTGIYLIPHELGHNFGLQHTFGYGSGEIPTDELVTRGPGANCETAGDFICDTPADPYGIPGAKTIVVNGCYQYDPNSTVRDANGEPYNPSLSNLMSYYGSCTHEFTPGQIDRMQAGLALRQSHTSYSLTAPSTNVNPPSNLNLSFTNGSVVLTWQDNASNEMGYFIERSTSPTTGFVPVGGVAPDVTTFTDNQVAPDDLFYYRIRPSNTTTDHLSSTASVSTNSCPTPLYPSSTPARVSASLYWTAAMPGKTYRLHWRPAGTQTWNTINDIPETPYSITYSLTALTSMSAYEWQVQTVCSTTANSEFTSIQSFTTLACQEPIYYYTSNVGGTSVQFSWANAYAEPGRTSDIRYRIAGTSTWTTISGINSSQTSSVNYPLTGLTNNTTYEWQLRNVCSASEQSAYSSVATFTTFCRTPGGLSNIPTATGATLGWSIGGPSEAGTTYEVRYRPVGNTVWTTVSNITGNVSSTGYSLTGLTANTQYEWQVRTICGAGAYSDYSVTRQFTTVCNVPTAQGLIASQITSTSVQFTWYAANDPGTQYEIRYRPVGANPWAMVSTTTTNNFSGTYQLTGLTNNTAYEWQLRGVCSSTSSSTFVAGPTFTTQCRIPGYAYASPQVTSAILIWEQVGTDVTYSIRYRPIGTADWTTISNVTSTSATATGLASFTNYEFQVRTHCQDGVATDFSSLSNFTTHACSIPVGLQTTAITGSSAQLNWLFYDHTADTRYEVRYRVEGAANWITLSNLSSTNTAGFVVLNGLSSVTSYEWQIRTLCSATDYSDFSSSVNFQTPTAVSDLTPILYVRPSTVSNTANISVVVDVVELNAVATSGSFVVKITKDSRINLSFPASATLVNNRSVQNIAWAFNGSDSNYYILSTSQSVAAGDRLSFGLTGTLSPGATSGVLAISAILLPMSLIETQQTNNTDADKIDYFQQ